MMMLIFERISSASGQAAKDQERSQSASSAPALFLIVFEILFPKTAWLLEQSSVFGDLAIKVDLGITLAAVWMFLLYMMAPGL